MNRNLEINIKNIKDLFIKNNYDLNDKKNYLEAKLEYAKVLNDSVLIKACEIILSELKEN